MPAGPDSVQEVQGEGSSFSRTLSHHPVQGHSALYAGKEGQGEGGRYGGSPQAVWSCPCCGEALIT